MKKQHEEWSWRQYLHVEAPRLFKAEVFLFSQVVVVIFPHLNLKQCFGCLILFQIRPLHIPPRCLQSDRSAGRAYLRPPSPTQLSANATQMSYQDSQKGSILELKFK